MKCLERERLKELARLATRELTWVLNEEARLLRSGDTRLAGFAAVVEEGMRHHQEVMRAYCEHIAEHHCVEIVSTA